MTLGSHSKLCTNRSKGWIVTVCCCLCQENFILTEKESDFWHNYVKARTELALGWSIPIRTISTFKILKSEAAEPQRDSSTLTHTPTAHTTNTFLTLWDVSVSFSVFIQRFSKGENDHKVVWCLYWSYGKRHANE